MKEINFLREKKFSKEPIEGLSMEEIREKFSIFIPAELITSVGDIESDEDVVEVQSLLNLYIPRELAPRYP